MLTSPFFPHHQTKVGALHGVNDLSIRVQLKWLLVPLNFVTQNRHIMVTVVSEVTLDSAQWSFPLCVYSGFLSMGSAPRKNLAVDFPWTGLNLPFKKHGRWRKHKIRLGAQCRLVALPPALGLAGLVILFIMFSVYSPCSSKLLPQGSLEGGVNGGFLRWCEWGSCKHE